MDDRLLFDVAIASGFLFSLLFFLNLSRLVAPYGRHHPKPKAASFPLPTRLSWSLMESPSLFLTLLIFSLGRYRFHPHPIPSILCCFFLAHYFHRVFIYPLRIRPSKSRNVPLSIVLASFVFNIYNSYIQARSLSHYKLYPPSWLSSFQFIFGACIFIVGMAINIWADSVLISLRTKSDGQSYKIPNGGLFEYITCPNYFGEILEWFGWAILTWSAAGLAFFLLTAGNLAPRAASHHQWYLKNFPNYPRSRKVLIPFIY